MHPYIQIECAKFYEHHDYYMLSLCSNSPFSIRYISERAKCIFKIEETETKEENQNRIEILDEEVDKLYHSYFSYKRYDMIYKFLPAVIIFAWNKKYSHLMKMDIARCFYHIYTHTIAWAVKGKNKLKS